MLLDLWHYLNFYDKVQNKLFVDSQDPHLYYH
jgi:hypothetical protein